MLYKILLLPARLLIHFYFRKIIINKKSRLCCDGPMLIASNHPNSFLDAIMLAILFKRPIYSLARGDAFAGKVITKILTSFNILPVYRISEGAENLEYNYTTFNACQHIFKKNGIILIFSEGKCKMNGIFARLKRELPGLQYLHGEKIFLLKFYL